MYDRSTYVNFQTTLNIIFIADLTYGTHSVVKKDPKKSQIGAVNEKVYEY